MSKMSGQKVVIEFVALFQTDDIPNGMSIEITPKTFTIDNLDILLQDRTIEIPLNVKIRRVGVKGGEFFQGFSQINDKLTYQYQIPLLTDGNVHKALRASINFRNELKFPTDMDIILKKMSSFERILEENKSDLTDIKETLIDMMFTSQSSQETIDTEDRFRALNFLDKINNVEIKPKNYLTLLDNIREMKNREESYGDDATRFAIVSDPDDKIWLRSKSFRS